jgi:hypothetical protein
MNAMQMIKQIQQATLDARKADKHPERGIIAVAVKNGRGQVHRVTYDQRGVASITHKHPFVPLNLIVMTLTNEAAI